MARRKDGLRHRRSVDHVAASEFDHAQRWLEISIVNGRRLLDRNELVITVPQTVDVRRDELELAPH
jgi:hypothetical protein